MGIATGVGMLSSTVLTLVVVPVFYVAMEDAIVTVRSLPSRLRRRRSAPEGSAPIEGPTAFR